MRSLPERHRSVASPNRMSHTQGRVRRCLVAAHDRLTLAASADADDACPLLRSAHLPALFTDERGVVLRASAAANKLLGDVRSAAGQTVSTLLPFVTPPGTGEVQYWQGAVALHDAPPLHLDVTGTPLSCRPAGGHLYILHDTSPFAEIDRIKEQFLFNVAHELRGPLAVLDNALEILGDSYAELSAVEMRRLITSARHTAARLRALMDDLLSAGAIQAGRFVVRARPETVQRLIDEGLAAAAATIEARQQAVEQQIADGLPLVRADVPAIARVFANLLSNAAKYSPEGATVVVRAVAAGTFVRFSVEDTGPGIPVAQQEGLFDRFYRSRAGNEPPGIGLGLAIARGVVEAHGGTIDVERDRPQGACVWFTLPLA